MPRVVARPHVDEGHPLSHGVSEDLESRPSWNWQTLSNIVTVPSYIVIGGAGGVRLWSSGEDEREADDPLIAMQNGIPALFYRRDEGGLRFERRVLKVDNTLEFLFIIDDTKPSKSSANSGPKAKRILDPVVVPLHQIGEIHTGDKAVSMCKQQSVRLEDSGVTNSPELAVVIDCRGISNKKHLNTLPPLESLLIFLVSSKQCLPMYLKACADACRQARADKGAGLKHAESKAATEYMDTVQVMNVEEACKHDSDKWELEIFWSGGAKQVVSVPCTLTPTDCPAELSKIVASLQHSIPPIDAARVEFILHETIALRSCAVNLEPNMVKHLHIFRVGGHRREGSILQGNTDGFESLVFDVEGELRKLRARMRSQGRQRGEATSQEVCEQASALSLLLALQQMLRLENDYAKLIAKPEPSAHLTSTRELVEQLAPATKVTAALSIGRKAAQPRGLRPRNQH